MSDGIKSVEPIVQPGMMQSTPPPQAAAAAVVGNVHLCEKPTPRRSPRTKTAATTKVAVVDYVEPAPPPPLVSQDEPMHTPPRSSSTGSVKKRQKVLSISTPNCVATSVEMKAVCKGGLRVNAPKFGVNQIITSTALLARALEINTAAQKLFDVEIMDTLAGLPAPMSIIQQPCVSARLFASFVLSLEQPSTCNLSLDESTHLAVVKPILPLLRAMVRVEFVALQSVELPLPQPQLLPAPKECTDDVTGDTQQQLQPQPQPQRKSVHFSSIDGSCARPPVDRDLSSAHAQRQSIDAMAKAKDAIMALTQPAIYCLQELSSFLTTKLTSSNDSDDTSSINEESLLLACSMAVAPNFPLQRVKSHVQVLVKDLAILERRLLKLYSTPLASPSRNEALSVVVSDSSEAALSVEHRLARDVGQAIRYQLRLLLNAAPLRMSKMDHAYEARSAAYSQICTLVTISMPDDAPSDNTAATDAAFSAFVSKALLQLNEFFGMEQMGLGQIAMPLDNIPSEFCTSEASKRPLDLRTVRKMLELPFSDGEVKEILRDIREATAFLASARAMRFLIDLLTAPGVTDEIQRMGGWTQIEAYALLSKQHKLWSLCSADAHLVSLCDTRVLLERLMSYDSIMAGSIEACQAALKQVQHNFLIVERSDKLSTTERNNIRATQKFPQLVEIAAAWIDGMHQSRSFPIVKAVKPTTPTNGGG